MDIIKFLKEIDIPNTSKEDIEKFILEHEISIKNNIFELWDKFKLNNTMDNKPSVENSYSCKQETQISDALLDQTTLSESTLPVINQTCNSLPNNEAIDSAEMTTNNINLSSTNNGQVSELNTDTNQSKNTTTSQAQEKADTLFQAQINTKNISIINGKVNQEYKFIFNVESLGIAEIGEFWVEGLDALGLTFNTQTNEITGVPTSAGDHKLKIKIKRSDWVEGKPVFERIITLIINPDPKSLWKNIPTPVDIEYYKPDCANGYVKVESESGLLNFTKKPKKDIVAASQRGRSHAQEGKPRDDDFKMKYLKEHDWYIISVADGAGSAKSSRKGSEIACNTVIEQTELHINTKTKELEHLIKEFHTEKTVEKRKKMGDMLYSIIGTAVFKAYKNIEEEAKKTNAPVKDFSTTLILSISKKFKFGWFVAAFWVGDGGIAIYNKETQFLKVLGESDGGEYAGQTRFLTMPEITQPTELYRRLRFDIVDDFTALILMTDGVTDPKFETDANLMKIEKWNELWNDLSKEVEFKDNNEASADQLLKWLDFWSPGNHDDRTIAILY